MGVDLNGALLLLWARQNGATFSRMATLGRQGLHANRPALISLLRGRGIAVPREVERKILDPTTKYSEDFFTLLGADEIIAIDASGYEGAQIVHDMNVPIRDSLASSFDVVFDGGTLEHIFNFSTAVFNAMQLAVVGGHFLSIAVTNNFSGHGFYQFSPELFYRLLSTENGYKTVACVLWEETQGSRFYQVPDPNSTKSRIELTSHSGTYMFFQAVRTGDVKRDYIPQQSDYVANWTTEPSGSNEIVEAKGLNSRLRGISLLRFLVQFCRAQKRSDMFRPHFAEAEYRRRRIEQNSRGTMSPLEDMRVRL